MYPLHNLDQGFLSSHDTPTAFYLAQGQRLVATFSMDEIAHLSSRFCCSDNALMAIDFEQQAAPTRGRSTLTMRANVYRVRMVPCVGQNLTFTHPSCNERVILQSVHVRSPFKLRVSRQIYHARARMFRAPLCWLPQTLHHL